MHILKRALLTLTACFGLTGCMQHNGDIGNWFGTWKLQSIDIDGTNDDSYQGNIFFQFQTSIVRIVEVYPEVSTKFSDCFGSWEEEGSTLILNFTYDADGKTGNFTPQSQTLLQRAENVLHIVESSSKTMVWTMQTDDPEQTITYSLKKQ